ncbi:MAG: transposase, partial [Frisingicoccus sp.]|nr:transposase [Frisingicoccus sp.]
MGKTDTITKDYMADNHIFADAFNYLIYNGEQVIH